MVLTADSVILHERYWSSVIARISRQWLWLYRRTYTKTIRHRHKGLLGCDLSPKWYSPSERNYSPSVSLKIHKETATLSNRNVTSSCIKLTAGTVLNISEERLYQFSWEITATRVFTLRRHWEVSFVPFASCGGVRWYASRVVFRPNYSTQPRCGLCYCAVRVALESPFASLYRTPRIVPLPLRPLRRTFVPLASAAACATTPTPRHQLQALASATGAPLAKLHSSFLLSLSPCFRSADIVRHTPTLCLLVYMVIRKRIPSRHLTRDLHIRHPAFTHPLHTQQRYEVCYIYINVPAAVWSSFLWFSRVACFSCMAYVNVNLLWDENETWRWRWSSIVRLRRTRVRLI